MRRGEFKIRSMSLPCDGGVGVRGWERRNDEIGSSMSLPCECGDNGVCGVDQQGQNHADSLLLADLILTFNAGISHQGQHLDLQQNYGH